MNDTDHPGFEIHDSVFSPSETQLFLRELDELNVTRTKAGARHLLRFPIVQSIANDPRLLRIAAWHLGGEPFPFRATLFAKSPHANWLVVWHQDTALPLKSRVDSAEWGPWSEKAGVTYAHAPAWALEKVIALRVHLDDSTARNGPLRVIPRTHLEGILSDEVMQGKARGLPVVECVGAAGSVVSMRPLLIHASSKATEAAPRRILHIEYAEGADLAPGIELVVS
jgi:hypothetical protein